MLSHRRELHFAVTQFPILCCDLHLSYKFFIFESLIEMLEKGININGKSNEFIRRFQTLQVTARKKREGKTKSRKMLKMVRVRFDIFNFEFVFDGDINKSFCFIASPFHPRPAFTYTIIRFRSRLWFYLLLCF